MRKPTKQKDTRPAFAVSFFFAAREPRYVECRAASAFHAAMAAQPAVATIQEAPTNIVIHSLPSTTPFLSDALTHCEAFNWRDHGSDATTFHCPHCGATDAGACMLQGRIE